MIQAIFWTALFVFVLIYSYYLVWGMFKGAPFVPSRKNSIKEILKQLEEIENPVIAELGSGDGRVAIAMAKKGYKVIGFEINPVLCLLAKLIGFLKGSKAEFRQMNFLKADLSNFDVLITYLYPGVMQQLQEKFHQELKPGTVIISNTFRFNNIKPVKEADDKILIYKLD